MQPPPPHPTHTDPVCGMELSGKTAAEELEYDSKTHYFCTEVCRESFEADPRKYLLEHRQHGVRRS